MQHQQCPQQSKAALSLHFAKYSALRNISVAYQQGGNVDSSIVSEPIISQDDDLEVERFHAALRACW